MLHLHPYFTGYGWFFIISMVAAIFAIYYSINQKLKHKVPEASHISKEEPASIKSKGLICCVRLKSVSAPDCQKMNRCYICEATAGTNSSADIISSLTHGANELVFTTRKRVRHRGKRNKSASNKGGNNGMATKQDMKATDVLALPINGVERKSENEVDKSEFDPAQVKKKNKVNCIATAKDLEAKEQKLIKTGVDANSVHTCTICSVVCNNDKSFASHIAGEKHRVKGSLSKGLAQVLMSQQVKHSANSSNPEEEAKRKKKNVLSAVQAPKVVQSVYCDICKVMCNTQETYNNHVAGQKHNKKFKNITTGNKPIEFVSARSTSPGTKTSGVIDNDKKIIYCDICKAICNSQEMYNNHVSGKNHNEKIKNLTTVDSKNASKEYLEMKMKKVLESGGKGDAVKICELCNVVCSSLTVFELHCSGQKHRNMVKKQEENFGGLAVTPTVAASTNNNDQEHMPASPLLKPEPKRKSKSASKEDLEMKKRKVLESGAKGDAVMVCDLCNVVCNGPMVFESHCRGQKHRSMVKKQKENFGGVAVTPAVVSAVMAAATS